MIIFRTSDSSSGTNSDSTTSSSSEDEKTGRGISANKSSNLRKDGSQPPRDHGMHWLHCQIIAFPLFSSPCLCINRKFYAPPSFEVNFFLNWD